jgi:hypothetical protein
MPRDQEPEAVVLSDDLRQQKLAKLLKIEGYDDVADLIEVVFSDAVSPAICCNPGCNYTCEMEPDQDRGWCNECHTNTMVAAPVLAEVI